MSLFSIGNRLITVGMKNLTLVIIDLENKSQVHLNAIGKRIVAKNYICLSTEMIWRHAVDMDTLKRYK